MSEHVATVEVEDKNKLLTEATAGFKRAYKEVRAVLSSAEMSVIDSRYKAGKLMVDMRDNHSKHGPKALERMELLIGRDRALIYNCVRFVEFYSDDDVKELKKLRNSTGAPLTWTHVVHLLVETDKEKHEKAKALCLENSWSSQKLLSYIQASNGGKKSSSAGKPMSRPSSFRGFIEQQLAIFDNVISRYKKVWAGTEKPGDVTFADLLKKASISDLNQASVDPLLKMYDEVIMIVTSLSREVRAELDFRNKAFKPAHVDLDDEEE